MDSTYHIIDTLVVKYQNAADSILSMVSKCMPDAATTVANSFNIWIVISICVTVAVIAIIIALVLNQWYNRENQSRLAEREYWLALKKEYQKLALEHIKVREGSSFESSQYLDYIDKLIRQIDEHLKRISGVKYDRCKKVEQ